MLVIRDLHVKVADTEILKGLSLSIGKGEVHAIMGPNGSGKSTLVNVLAGKPEYVVTSGAITFEGKNVLPMTVDQRAREGIFLAFQYPVELPGVSAWQFMKTALDSIREQRGEEPMDYRVFDKMWRQKIKDVGIDQELVKRSVNEGFSGGEKKRSEMLQMMVLDPKLALMDETDSGLDIDALKSVADVVNKRRGPEKAVLVVTHYQRLLNYIVPDFVHILIDGRIVRSGGAGLALEVEEKGYDWVREAMATA
ncbi:MAG: Fe-S cluster assembly ATPase SufC [Dehalococcoidia bacterium]|nr:Fe-S cluster assembly ATPase SufC [Dehalococcoidia bacterium]